MYTQVWNDYSQEIFKQPYAQLERKDKKVVRNKYPLVISIEQQY